MYLDAIIHAINLHLCFFFCFFLQPIKIKRNRNKENHVKESAFALLLEFPDDDDDDGVDEGEGVDSNAETCNCEKWIMMKKTQ